MRVAIGIKCHFIGEVTVEGDGVLAHEEHLIFPFSD